MRPANNRNQRTYAEPNVTRTEVQPVLQMYVLNRGERVGV